MSSRPPTKSSSANIPVPLLLALAAAALSLWTAACTAPGGYTGAGCSANYRSGITSSTPLDVTDAGRDIFLAGTLAVYTGTLTVQVTDPEGRLLWTREYSAGNVVTLEESFPAVVGRWILYVESGEETGSGDVDIRMSQTS